MSWIRPRVGGNPERYQVQLTSLPSFADSNPRPPAPSIDGSVKVASFNVLNYFTTLGSRGADTPEELERQTAKIVAALAEIDADILGLIGGSNRQRQRLGTDQYAAIVTRQYRGIQCPGRQDLHRRPC